MRFVPFSVIGLIALFSTACGTSSQLQPSSSKPLIKPGVALRPEFAYGESKTQRTGTAFVVRAKSEEKYLVTAAHLYRDDEWPTMRTISLRTMAGDMVARCDGPPIYV